jgi:hypothetical protein
VPDAVSAAFRVGITSRMREMGPCLPGSGLPDTLGRMGHELREERDGERILPVATREVLTQNSDGSLGILTEGSTRPASVVVTAAGIHRTKRFSFAPPA